MTDAPVPIHERWAWEDEQDEREGIWIIRNGRRVELKNPPPDRRAPADELSEADE